MKILLIYEKEQKRDVQKKTVEKKIMCWNKLFMDNKKLETSVEIQGWRVWLNLWTFVFPVVYDLA